MSDSRTYRLGDFSTTVRFCTPREALLVNAERVPLYLSDTNVTRIIKDLLPPDLDPRHVLVFPAGEEHKEWPQIQQAILRGFDLGLARDDWFVAVGGGVVTDMGAFAASIYLRGCKVALVPTTLLAMVDASFGGKTGIDFGGYKNMVGSFYPAHELHIAPAFLTTLPESDFRSGLGEVIKHAILDDEPTWKLLHNRKDAVLARDPELLHEIVRSSLAVKGRVVEADLKEQSIRAHLNLGHTFGHALESVAGFGTWTHGEAVCWGIVRALLLSVRLGLAEASYAKEVRQLIEAYGFRTHCQENPQALLNAMKMDKKKKGGQVRFVLQEGLCKTQTRPVDDADILSVLADA